VPATLVRRAVDAAGAAVREGGSVAAAAPPRPGQPLGVLVVEPAAEGVRLLPTTVVVVAGAILLATGIALLLARATTRPLAQLGDAAARIAGGDLTTSLDVRSRDEVGRLADVFNAMTRELRRHVGALEASRDELHAGLARLGDTLSGTHDLDRILSVVLETTMAATQAEAGCLLLVGRQNPPDPGGPTVLRLAVGRGLQGRGTVAGFSLPLGLGITGRVAQDAEPVRGWIGDRLPSGPGEPRAECVLAVPLMRSGAVLGVVALYDRPGGFADSDLTTIRSFAGQASVAVDNVLLYERAQRLSLTDGLTGLWNYRYFSMAIGKEIERAARFSRPLALLMIDLDRFKDVNDRFGHQRGDAVLADLAARLRQQVRDVDTVARYGGEEVVVILPETDEDGAVQTAERLCEAVRSRPFQAAGEPDVALTVSVGAAVFPLHGASVTSLLRRADEALYDAKRAGRDTWRLAVTLDAPQVDPH
jgi:diguanylate cyclase (GGDEF)-like protein